MSKLEELLQGVDVEWKSLSEIGEISGAGVDKKIIESEKSIKLLNYMDIYRNKYITKDIPSMIVSASDIKIKQCNVLKGDIFFTPSSEVLNDIGKSSVALENIDGVVYSYHIMRLRLSNLNIITSMYVNYMLGSDNVQNQINKKAKGLTRFGLTKTQWQQIVIPIPCPDNPEKSLEIQQEIVSILDQLTETTNKLKNELEKERQIRKNQFESFREQLFNNKSDNESWKILEEIIIKTYSGSTPRAGDVQYYNNGTIPWLRTQEVRFCEILDTEIKITELAVEKTGAKWIPINCVIIAISGATAGRSAINKIPLTTNQHCLCLEINSDKALYKYVYHWIKFNYENIKSLGRGARGDLNSSIIKNFKIPIPSLEEQERIVKLLDQFDATHTAIEEEITKEIKLRTQQYEYYREKLLTFPEN